MQKPAQRSITRILNANRDYLLSRVSKVRILGEAGERELKDVFVELSIVDHRSPHQQAEFLGMMDATMRQRFDPLANIDASPQQLHQRGKATKLRVRPHELLRHRTKAIVAGAPGCGKTTLLKYLALRAQEGEKRLVVWLELKAIDKPLFAQAEKAAAHDGCLMLQELWLTHIKAQLSLNDAEIKFLRRHWQEKFRANEIAVLLDGFDEVQDETIESSLNKSIREFASAAHDNTLLISTRPYAQSRLGNEGLQELEIDPLNQRQIEAFLNCYYPNDLAAKSLLKNLRERSSLRELLHVPLLLGVILRLHRENRFTYERLKLYEMIVTDLAYELDRSKSITRRFKIEDERLRLDFLKFLAFERLLRASLDEGERESSRLVFSYDLLREEAGKFLSQENLLHNPRDLANDALATPLLREVRPGTFAFTHLILQEYLAAHAFAAFHKNNNFEGLKIFCRGYHSPLIVEMEVLPMMMGIVTNADSLYDEIERWPESLTFANLRLRARGLAYSVKIRQQRIATLCEKLGDAVTYKDIEGYPYRIMVINSFANTCGAAEDYLIASFSSLLANPDPYYRMNVIEGLAMIGSERAVDVLLQCFQDKDPSVQVAAADFVGWTGSELAVDTLIAALRSDNVPLRWNAATALGRIGSVKAIEPLRIALKDSESGVRSCAIEALQHIGTETAAKALTDALREEQSYLRQKTILAIGEIGSEKFIEDLILCLRDSDSHVRSCIAQALKQIGPHKTTPALRRILQSEDSQIRQYAVEVLGHIASNEAIGILLKASQDKNNLVRKTVANTLATAFLFSNLKTNETWVGSSIIEETNRQIAVRSLIAALKDEDEEIRATAARALTNLPDKSAIPHLHAILHDKTEDVRANAASTLGFLGSKRSVDLLIKTLTDEVSDVRARAACSLGRIGSTKAIDPLLNALLDEDPLVRRYAAIALGDIGSKRAVAHLLKALHDEDYKVRGFAAEALAEIGDECSFEPLLELLKDSEGWVREHAAESLGKIGGELALDALSLMLNDESGHVRTCAVEQIAKITSEKSVGLLGTALRDLDVNVNKRAANALGDIRSERAITILIEALRDENHHTRWSAIEALVQIEAESIVAAIFHVVSNPTSDLRGYAAWYLSKCDELELETAVIKSLGNEEPFVRHRAAQIIGYYSDNPNILKELSNLVKHEPDNRVRDTAWAAMEQFKRKLELLGHPVIEGATHPWSNNESSEGVLVHDVGRIVSLAGHFFREVLKYDEGIDGEIEFRNEKGRGTGKRVYLQLKSGDSYLYQRKRDGKEIFTIKNHRHAEYWLNQAYPVLLVIRNSCGQIRWMNMTEYLQRRGTNIRQVEFQGEPFTVVSVKQMWAKFGR